MILLNLSKLNKLQKNQLDHIFKQVKINLKIGSLVQLVRNIFIYIKINV